MSNDNLFGHPMTVSSSSSGLPPVVGKRCEISEDHVDNARIQLDTQHGVETLSSFK